MAANGSEQIEEQPEVETVAEEAEGETTEQEESTEAEAETEAETYQRTDKYDLFLGRGFSDKVSQELDKTYQKSEFILP